MCLGYLLNRKLPVQSCRLWLGLFWVFSGHEKTSLPQPGWSYLYLFTVISGDIRRMSWPQIPEQQRHSSSVGIVEHCPHLHCQLPGVSGVLLLAVSSVLPISCSLVSSFQIAPHLCIRAQNGPSYSKSSSTTSKSDKYSAMIQKTNTSPVVNKAMITIAQRQSEMTSSSSEVIGHNSRASWKNIDEMNEFHGR